MNKLDNAVEQLIAAIMDSVEYHEYDIQRNKVNENPELKAKLDEMRARNFEIQSSGENNLQKVEQFEKEYSEFIENSLVHDFLIAELAFCRMVQDINHRLTEAVNFE